mgnify:CR=1 FL=1
MLENIPCCQDIVPYIRYHHEHWDGSGFPKHLRGANIPLGARIIAVADYYDMIINPSTEFWAKTKKQAVRELFSSSGLLFDPEVVKAFIENLRLIQRVYASAAGDRHLSYRRRFSSSCTLIEKEHPSFSTSKTPTKATICQVFYHSIYGIIKCNYEAY